MNRVMRFSRRSTARDLPRRNRWCAAALCAAALALWTTAAAAQDKPSDEVGGQLEMRDKDGHDLGACPLKHTDVHADVSGFVARVHVQQQFHNDSHEPVEAIYTFPLPNDAAVDAMTLIVGDRRIRGLIKRKEEARHIYEQAKTEGKTASLLDQERPNIFTQSVANIMPGEDITVDISYVNTLKYEEGEYEFTFPTVVGPRYTPSGGYQVAGRRGDASAPLNGNEGSSGASALTDADRITPPIIPEGMHAGHDISLTVDLNAALPLGEIKSVLHPIAVSRPSPTHALVRLNEEQALPNKDFILRFGLVGSEVKAGLLTFASGEGRDGYFTLIVQPPAAPPEDEIAPKEMIFVIDQTGSQNGWPIEKAKETMRYCISHLHRHDTFQLLGFNTQLFPCFPGPVAATRENIKTANDFLDPINGAGGTDILQSVQYALKLKGDPARPRIVCYMTDGYVGNDMQIIDCVRRNRGSARMFPFGVGNSVNRFLIDGMASEGRGAAQYVTLDESGKEAAEKFQRRIDDPLLLDIDVDWNDLPVEEVFPRHIPDVFSAGPIIIKGRYTHAAEGDITVRGILRGRAWRQVIHIVLPSLHPEGSALASMWARAKIDDLQAQDWLGTQMGKPDPDMKEKITAVALHYGLMTQFTSFVAVEDKIVNPGGLQNRADVPVEMPKGVNYKGIFGTSASAATPGAGRYAVAPNSNLYARVGDPLIAIEAPSTERQVVALLPTGEIKRLFFNAANQRWEARFDIPAFTPQGAYEITVIVVHEDGSRKIIRLGYTVHTTPPSGFGQAWLNSSGNSGRTLELTLKASADTQRVVALLPWGERERLARREAGSNEFDLAVPVPEGQSAGSVTYVLTDNAHNHTTIVVDMDR